MKNIFPVEIVNMIAMYAHPIHSCKESLAIYYELYNWYFDDVEPIMSFSTFYFSLREEECEEEDCYNITELLADHLYGHIRPYF